MSLGKRVEIFISAFVISRSTKNEINYLDERMLERFLMVGYRLGVFDLPPPVELESECYLD